MAKLFVPVIAMFFLFKITAVFADVKPNSLFTDHMVLQQGKDVPVWGEADNGEKVMVSFNGKSVATTAADGRWLVKLPKMKYSTVPATLIISGKNMVKINDVLVGEVWLCSGQSNMERQLGPRPPQQPITDWKKERDAADYPLIREYYVPLKYAAEKVADVNSKWTVCSPATVSNFSAVGYFFARDLYKKLNIPVGIIFSAFGGTPAEDWTSEEALKSNPKLADLVNNYGKVKPGYQPAGQRMSGLYNGMINPLLPYAIKGVAWYQGEANNERTEIYPTILSNMIANWRTDFKQGNFPFLIVQVAPHKEMRPELREAQLKVSQSVKNTALIVTIDCGDANDIHPPHKQPVGERLALAAEALAYGQKTEYSGPLFSSAKIIGDKMSIRFTHTGKGLSTKEKLTGFTIAGADKKFVPAEAVVKGNEVMVSAKEVTKPMVVRYGWANVPVCNLYNSEGLPASPFRTDID